MYTPSLTAFAAVIIILLEIQKSFIFIKRKKVFSWINSNIALYIRKVAQVLVLGIIPRYLCRSNHLSDYDEEIALSIN